MRSETDNASSIVWTDSYSFFKFEFYSNSFLNQIQNLNSDSKFEFRFEIGIQIQNSYSDSKFELRFVLNLSCLPYNGASEVWLSPNCGRTGAGTGAKSGAKDR